MKPDGFNVNDKNPGDFTFTLEDDKTAMPTNYLAANISQKVIGGGVSVWTITSERYIKAKDCECGKQT